MDSTLLEHPRSPAHFMDNNSAFVNYDMSSMEPYMQSYTESPLPMTFTRMFNRTLFVAPHSFTIHSSPCIVSPPWL